MYDYVNYTQFFKIQLVTLLIANRCVIVKSLKMLSDLITEDAIFQKFWGACPQELACALFSDTYLHCFHNGLTKKI